MMVDGDPRPYPGPGGGGGKALESAEILLGTDGSVTRILEVITGGPVRITTLSQEVVGAGKEVAGLLRIREGDPVNHRVVKIEEGGDFFAPHLRGLGYSSWPPVARVQGGSHAGGYPHREDPRPSPDRGSPGDPGCEGYPRRKRTCTDLRHLREGARPLPALPDHPPGRAPHFYRGAVSLPRLPGREACDRRDPLTDSTSGSWTCTEG